MTEERAPLLTIAVPTYDRAHFLRRALDSIVKQNDGRVEILVSDNASPDETESVVKEFSKKAENLRYIRNAENIGPDENFLQCYREAKGKFVHLLGDDDLLIDGTLSSLLEFLEGEGKDCTAVFLNHVFFQNEYRGREGCTKPFVQGGKTLVTGDKGVFIGIARYQLTYMSSFLLKREAALRIEAPGQYKNSSFMHTYLCMAATKGDTLLGYYGEPVIAQDCTPSNTSFYGNQHRIFEVFGLKMERVLCGFSLTCGYEKKQMDRIYEDAIKNWRYAVLTMKAQNNAYWKEEFKKYGVPILKKHKRARRRIMPYVRCPKWLAKFAFQYVRPIYKKLKRGS